MRQADKVLEIAVQTGPNWCMLGPISTTMRAYLVLHEFICTPIVTK